MLGIIKKYICRIIYILLIIYLLIFIPTIIGYKPLVVISGSMEPTLKVGGLLYYEKYNYDEYEKGDILIYQYDDHVISHRIYDITDNGIITKGDANNTYDNLVIKEENILGKGTNWCIPYIGYYADFIFRHRVILLIPFLLIIGELLYEKFIKKKGDIDEK